MMNKNADLYLKNYDYELNPSFIAKYPSSPKSLAKLLVYDVASSKISHHLVKDLPRLLPPCEIFFNNTLVIKARLFAFKKSGAKRELFISKLAKDHAKALIKGRVKEGDLLKLKDIHILIGRLYKGLRRLDFFKNNEPLLKKDILKILKAYGHIPLPPYIKREDEEADEQNYQSIFAKNAGAIAAPTASLHFDKELINALSKAHCLHSLTLHVGLGTFKGVECADIREHIMHQEYFHIPKSSQAIIKSPKKLLSIGTTVARSIEYFVRTNKASGQNDLFLHPGNKPLRVNHLMTNFHLPKSTLLMLVASFIGREKSLELYEEAKEQNYRFYSYGDAMLILNYL